MKKSKKTKTIKIIKKRIKKWNQITNMEKQKREKKHKLREAFKGGYTRDGSKKVFSIQMLQEIVLQLRPTKIRFWAPD